MPLFGGALPPSSSIFVPQPAPTNRSYLLPFAVVPPLPSSLPPQGSQFPALPMPFLNTATSSPSSSQPMMQFLTPQQQFVQQQQLLASQQFLKQLQAYGQSRNLPAVVPASQQSKRDYSLDTYFYDEWKNQSKLPTSFQQQQQQRGPGVYSVDELQVIPLQRVNALAAANQGVAATDGTIVAVTANGTPAPPASLAVITPSTNGKQGTQTAMQFWFQDLPRIRLGVDQDHYFAGIAICYSLLTGLLPMDQSLEYACRSFDIDEDTIGVTESQLETLLYNVTEKQGNKVRPMLFTFPLHDRYMSMALRVFIYGEIVTDPRTGFKRTLTTLSPWSWRHALPTGDNAFRLRGENIESTSDEYKLRKRYHEFLVRLYSMMWRSLMRLRVEQTSLFTADYARFVESTLTTLRPAAQSVAVLEARIRAIAARMQLLHGLFFNTAAFYTEVDALKTVIHPIILTLIGRYLYFRVQA